jgi:hypothetical protein
LVTIGLWGAVVVALRVLANVLRLALWLLLFFFLSLHADTRSDSSYSCDFRVFLF